jgi:hypothetical protein
VRTEPKGLNETVILRLDGNKLSYSNDSPQAASVPGTIRARKSTFDGQKVMRYDQHARPTGSIARGERSPEHNLWSIKSILLTLRPLDENTGGFDLTRFHPCPSIQVDGHTLLGLTASGRSGLSYSVWLDPLKDYTVGRYVESVNGEPAITVNIEYQRDEKHGWLPVYWNSIWVNPETKQLLSAEEANITAYEINAPIPAEQFRIDFPPGTLIIDRIKATQYIAQ